ncbi:MAG: DUF3048 domain-containing protein [Clostridia bacterium]|nr:DUF3048 domain-containing protein [Clostridia bacterium]
MLKRIFSLTLCLLMLLPFTGCRDKDYTLSVDNEETASVEEPVTHVNPLTGVKDLDKETALQRPVAIMVNNISVAQSVQTGLNKADIVYETEVEGGITRLLAVFQDFKNVEQIGTVRSSRYVYIDLAAGHNALYAYHGIDEEHASPHLNAVDSIVVGENNGGKRISNGLATEHTLYAYGDKLWESMEKKFETALNSESTPWANFANEKTDVNFESAANTVSVPFSTSYKTIFKYNPQTGRYTRFFNGVERTDYNTNESVTVKNVFVLNTTISDYAGCTEYAKGKSPHRKVDLTSGSGYYFVNGTYTKINWTKGVASDSFKFTNEDGTPLTVNTGNSWVCIADINKSQAIISE